MLYADLFVGILIIVLLILVAVRVLSASNPAQTGRSVRRDEQGKVIVIGERQGTSPGEFSGRGTQTSPPLQLAPGTYRIDYQFDALTRLALLDATGEDTLFIKSGAGTEALTIEAVGRYRLLVEPTDENAAWSIHYRPIMTRATSTDTDD
jgi:hypothetical protein